MNLKPIDLDALERAVEQVCRAESATSRRRIDDRLAAGESWIDIAVSCALRCQFEALQLAPWQSAPCMAHITEPRRDQHAAELLRRLLDAGLSRFEPSPIAALERAGKRVATAK